eukprot:1400940-Heterocapsa_arctica.AAC.1
MEKCAKPGNLAATKTGQKRNSREQEETAAAGGRLEWAGGSNSETGLGNGKDGASAPRSFGQH